MNKLTKSFEREIQETNKVCTQQITSKLVTATINLTFVNEACQFSGIASKSQVFLPCYLRGWNRFGHLLSSIDTFIR